MEGSSLPRTASNKACAAASGDANVGCSVGCANAADAIANAATNKTLTQYAALWFFISNPYLGFSISPGGYPSRAPESDFRLRPKQLARQRSRCPARGKNRSGA